MDRVCLICTDAIPSTDYSFSCSTLGCNFGLCLPCAGTNAEISRCGCGQVSTFKRLLKSRRTIPFDLENWLVEHSQEDPLIARRIVWGFAEFFDLRQQKGDVIPSPPIDRLWAMFQGDAKYYHWAMEQGSADGNLILRQIPETDLVTDPRYSVTCSLLAEPVDPVAWPNRPKVSMQIFIRKMDGRTTTLRVEPSWTVSTLKSLILKETGTPLYQQRLIHAGHQLLDEWTLADYNIQRESTIHLVLALRGD